MRRSLVGFALLATLAAPSAFAKVGPPACAVAPAHSTCTIVAPIRGIPTLAFNGTFEIDVFRQGVQISRTCFAGTDAGGLLGPVLAKGDRVLLKALTRGTTASIAALGTGFFDVGTGQRINCS